MQTPTGTHTASLDSAACSKSRGRPLRSGDPLRAPPSHQGPRHREDPIGWCAHLSPRPSAVLLSSRRPRGAPRASGDRPRPGSSSSGGFFSLSLSSLPSPRMSST